MGFALRDPSTSYPTLLILALLCGLGRRLQLQHGQHQLLLSQGKKGLATGLNAGIGNLGVSLVQFAVPVAISAGMFGALGGEPQQAMVRARRPISGCRTPASSGCCRSRWPRWRPGSA